MEYASISKMIAIIDYGAGNLKSISNGFKKVCAEVSIASDADSLSVADAIVLPGVGNFGDAMQRLDAMKQPIREQVGSGKPFLGLCLGLQVLFGGSDEAPGLEGLGLLRGKCRRFPKSAGKIPHMGWDSLEVEKDTPLLSGIKTGDQFYFVHSYYADASDRGCVAASCDYGVRFPAVVAEDNVFACQFHPERSGEKGLRILKNFVREAKK